MASERLSRNHDSWTASSASLIPDSMDHPRFQITNGPLGSTRSNRGGYRGRRCDISGRGNRGSVSTGAVDPLPEINGLCKEYGLWFHVDGAYGGFAAAVPQAQDDLLGLSLADSVAVDPHKWLYAPLEAGCALVTRFGNAVRRFRVSPSLPPFRGEGYELCRLWSPELATFPCPESLACTKARRSCWYRNVIAEDNLGIPLHIAFSRQFVAPTAPSEQRGTPGSAAGCRHHR